MYLNAAGSLAAETRMDVIANNLANVDTPGFRRGFAVFQQRLAEVWEPPVLQPTFDEVNNRLGGGLFVHETTFSDEIGTITPTDERLDLAIEGEGWFPIEHGDQVLYTRAGNFTRDAEGIVRTANGQGALLDENGERIRIPGDGQWLTIDESGQVRVDDEPIARIRVQGDLDYRQYTPVGENLYRFEGEGEPAPSNATLRQGFLERSSVRPVVEMVNLIRTHRAYEANQRMITQQDQSLGRAVNDVGRIQG